MAKKPEGVIEKIKAYIKTLPLTEETESVYTFLFTLPKGEQALANILDGTIQSVEVSLPESWIGCPTVISVEIFRLEPDKEPKK